LIRNSVDHGIESAEKRLAAGKPEAGHVWLTDFHEGGNLIIEVRDDGGGLNPEIIKQKAIEKGVLSPQAQISDEEAYQLIFAPGFSTKAVVTEVSGRGVGLDVVKTNIEKLQGDISISTQLGAGTTFRIRLPLTLSIINGMIVETQSERYVIPLAHVHESVRPKAGDVHTVSGNEEIFSLRGEVLPFYCLNRILGRKATTARSLTDSILIVVRTLRQPFAVRVDDIVGQTQIVIKKLGNEHRNLKGFSGSAILGDGRPSLILELPELVRPFQPKTDKPRSVA
jgi:two-component system chemotaxis sensor kinase CheA